ncbi:hypothetical protein TKK_0015928 [Trichogramma kaykai]
MDGIDHLHFSYLTMDTTFGSEILVVIRTLKTTKLYHQQIVNFGTSAGMKWAFMMTLLTCPI